ncbi:hypothetical protein HMJ29_01580 [Hymenobacter taeanensis]|uniref:DUF998 domain-containing protein n=1 Tax=Hymenobacter taeanensis TaxID=2735321 RepID=A0A6M6BEV4_9BACT|nr:MULTISPECIES: hypothetical protein [Hymenobacter]QJX45695.1 hypothetical protein HMJ29_01580 [Hymenobacter taeanensis]UOQ79533.1 hypothetical protein MUN83_11785 [Hymenobacter sp. 5414T-23]
MKPSSVHDSLFPLTEPEFKEDTNELVFSYLTLRNLIGFSGIFLPVILIFMTVYNDGIIIKPSISDYYYSSSGDFLVVMLTVLGVFLFAYNGYNWKEKTLTTLAGICAIGVAFSPTTPPAPDEFSTAYSIHSATKFPGGSTTPDAIAALLGENRHFIFAATFFACLAVMSLVYFPKTKSYLKNSVVTTTMKVKRNIVYRVCGWIIVGCIVILGIYFLAIKRGVISDTPTVPVVFIFESIGIEAFGIAWITKGQTLWPDGEHYLTKAYKQLVKSFD